MAYEGRIIVKPRNILKIRRTVLDAYSDTKSINQSTPNSFEQELAFALASTRLSENTFVTLLGAYYDSLGCIKKNLIDCIKL